MKRSHACEAEASTRSMRRRPVRRARGAVLIVVLGVLVLLVLLATTFNQLTSLERGAAHGYVDQVRARLIARSGVDRVISEIVSLANRGAFNDPAMYYWGNNTTETGIPDWATPLERAKNVSYAWEDEDVQNPTDPVVTPLLLNLDGVPVGFSRPMENSTYGANGDIYRLRVEDANSKIYVNDGVDGGKDGNVTRNTRRVLNTLGKVIGVSTLGDRIIDGRPLGGFRSKGELERLLGPAEFAKVRPYVTTSAWVDKNVVNPVPLSQQAASNTNVYPVHYNQQIGLYRYGRSKNSIGNPLDGIPLKLAPDMAIPKAQDHAIFAMDEINAQWIERVSRAPVNINGASEEVLTALIAGLRGFFVVERRRTNPIPYNVYSFLNHPKYDYAPVGQSFKGDEWGYLYSTAPFLAPGDSATGGIPAADVAKEIILCRTKQKSAKVPGLDYAQKWFGGPFRTWRQFNAFCDALVDRGKGGLLVDKRSIYFDCQPSAPNQGYPYTGPEPLVASEIQKRWAAQALADVLKANFNPNVTLNELNPDSNLYLIVDKTDLLCNSTEFCFTPMGVFDIESEGLVVRTEGDADLLAVRAGTVAARQKIAASVRAFDAFRHTSQAQFYGDEKAGYSEITLRPSTAPATNNNKTLELGPEPDNGIAPMECRWSGWIQLPTLGGVYKGSEAHKPDKVPKETQKGGATMDSSMHAHFTLDHKLHHSASSSLFPIDSKQTAGKYRNNPDHMEGAVEGPYGPTGPVHDPSAVKNKKNHGRYRLAYDWDLGNKSAASEYRTASDLRIDGAYVERDSAVMYEMSSSVFGDIGTVALWFKPAYVPEMTGKPRTYFSADTMKSGGGGWGGGYQIINGIWFFASHGGPAYGPQWNESYKFFYNVYPSGSWMPISLNCGFSMWDYIGGGIGKLSDSLNHLSHAHPAAANKPPDILRHHRWTHVIYQWDFGKRTTSLWVNGEEQINSQDVLVHQDYKEVKISAADFYEIGNCIRIGEPSKSMEVGSGLSAKARNWSADATVDEFFVWVGDRKDAAQDLFARGRYFRASPATPGQFTSIELQLPTTIRVLPVGVSGGLPPVSSDGPAAPPVVPPTMTFTKPQAKILAAAWTWYAEETLDEDGAGGLKKGTPVLYDYRDPYDPIALKPELEVSLLLNKTDVTGPLADEGRSVVANLVVNETDKLQYRFKLRIPGVNSNTVLLTTPVIDDITLYFTAGLEYLSYELVEVSL